MGNRNLHGTRPCGTLSAPLDRFTTLTHSDNSIGNDPKELRHSSLNDAFSTISTASEGSDASGAWPARTGRHLIRRADTPLAAKTKKGKKSVAVLPPQSPQAAVSREASLLKKRKLFCEHFLAARSNMDPDRLGMIDNLFKSCSKLESPFEGVISREAFEHHFAELFDGIGTTMTDRLFATISNGDDAVTFKSIVSALFMWGEGTMKDKLTLMFEMWDYDPCDGFLTKNEIAGMVKAVSVHNAASTRMMMQAQGYKDRSESKDSDPLEEEAEAFVDNLFVQMDHNSRNRVSLDDWLAFAGEETDILSFVNGFVLPVDMSLLRTRSWRPGSGDDPELPDDVHEHASDDDIGPPDDPTEDVESHDAFPDDGCDAD